MEQEPVLNAHNKDEYPPMHTGGSNTPLKKPSVINCCFVWLLKYWWVPVCLTTLCYSFDLAGDFYSYANHTDYLIDWFPYTHVLLLLGLLSFLWRGISFFCGISRKEVEDCFVFVSISFIKLGVILLCKSTILSL